MENEQQIVKETSAAAEQEPIQPENTAEEQKEREENAKRNDQQLLDRLSKNGVQTKTYQLVMEELVARHKIYVGDFEKDDLLEPVKDASTADFSNGFYFSPDEGGMINCRVTTDGTLRMISSLNDNLKKISPEVVEKRVAVVNDENETVGERVDTLNELLKNHCVYDQNNRMITARNELLKTYGDSRIRIHSPFGDDAMHTELIDNPLSAVQKREEQQIEEAFRVLGDKNATEEQRQKTVNGLIKEGFKIMTGKAYKAGEEIKNAAEIGTSFRIGLPSAQGNDTVTAGYCCQKTTTGEYFCFNSREYLKDLTGNNKDWPQAGFGGKVFREDRFLKENSNEKAFSDDNDEWKKAKTDKLMHYHYLYDENDQLINDQETFEAKDAVIVHQPDISTDRKHNVLVVRTPGKTAGDYVYHSFNSDEMDRDEVFMPLARAINGQPTVRDVQKISKIISQNKDASFGEVRNAALNALAKAGYVVDPLGKPITDPAELTNGKRFILQAAEGNTLYKEGFEMTASGAARSVTENFAHDYEGYTDFVKASVPQPKKPNGFWQAIDSIVRIFNSKGTDRINRYNAQVKAYDNMLYHGGAKMKLFEERSGVKKTEEMREAERKMLAKAMAKIYTNDISFEILSVTNAWKNDAVFDKFTQRPEIAAWLLQGDEKQLADPADTMDSLLTETALSTIRAAAENQLEDRAEKAKQNREKHLDEIKEINKANAVKNEKQTERVKPIENTEEKINDGPNVPNN